jgi:hypothetical protein
MNEQLLQKLLRLKLKISANALKELPDSVQHTAYTFLEMLQEELQAHLEHVPKQQSKPSDRLKNISID